MPSIDISVHTAIRYGFDAHFPLLMTLTTSQHQPAFPSFLHNPPRPPQNASGFLQTSLSKILGNGNLTSPPLGSPRISDER
jgi:hypothetical protein